MKKGWEIKRLDEVCDFQNGFAFKSKTFKEDGTPIVRITNIQNNSIELDGCVFVNRKDYSQDLSKYEVHKGDLLIAMSGATTGKIGIHRSDEVLLLNQRVGLFKPKDTLERDFLYYFLSTKVEESLAISAGAAQPNLSTRQIKNFEIPYPPLSEQQRIVSLLDHSFAAIDQAKANAEQNLQNAKELFESYLQGVFEKKGDGWEEKKVGEVFKIIGGGTPSKSKKEYYEGSIPWATVRDMKNFYLDSTQFRITKEAVENSSTNVIEKGNVIIATRVGLGRVCLLEQDTAINQDLKGIIPKQGFEINKEYLFYWFQSIESFLVNSGTGMTVKGIRVDFVKSILFPFPSITKQEEIASWLNNLYTKTQQLQSHYQKKIDDLEELKKSILQKAFAGELKTEKMVEELEETQL